MEYFRNHLGEHVTMDKIASDLDIRRGSISSGVTALMNAGWRIEGDGYRGYICYSVGSFDAPYKSGGRSLNRKPIPIGTFAGPKPKLAAGDLLEVLFISRAGTIIAEDGDGNRYEVKGAE
jgi:biotin operon repressor